MNRKLSILLTTLTLATPATAFGRNLRVGDTLKHGGVTLTVLNLADKTDCSPSTSTFSMMMDLDGGFDSDRLENFDLGSRGSDVFGPQVTAAITCKRKEQLQIMGDVISMYLTAMGTAAMFCAQPHLAVAFGTSAVATQLAMITVKGMKCEILTDKEKAKEAFCNIFTREGIKCDPKKAEYLMKQMQ